MHRNLHDLRGPETALDTVKPIFNSRLFKSWKLYTVVFQCIGVALSRAQVFLQIIPPAT